MKRYKVDTLTMDQIRELIANGDDTHNNQIRVDKSGYVYLSQDIVGSEAIDNLCFRLESFDAYNGYVGPKAANNLEYISSLYHVIRKNWPNPCSSYIDYWD